MKVIYVAGAYRARTHWLIHKNVLHAEEVGLKYWKQGFAVIVPHKLTEFYQDECPDDVWLKGCEELVKRSDIIVMIKGFENSQGSKRELELATELGKEIIYE